MNQPTMLLYFMLLAYIFPIAFVYYKYKAQAQETGTRSISSIITSTEPFILFAPDTSSATATATAPPPLMYSKPVTLSHFVCSSWPDSPFFMNIRDSHGLSPPSPSSSAGYSV